MYGAKRKGRGAQAYSVVRRASRPEARQNQAQKAPGRRLAMLKTLKVPGSEAPYPDLTNTDKERQVNLLEGGETRLRPYFTIAALQF